MIQLCFLYFVHDVTSLCNSLLFRSFVPRINGYVNGLRVVINVVTSDRNLVVEVIVMGFVHVGYKMNRFNMIIMTISKCLFLVEKDSYRT